MFTVSPPSPGGISAHAGFVRFHERQECMEVGTSSIVLLPYTPSSVGVARRHLVGELREAGVGEATACDAGLVVSELISNALRHATPLPGGIVRVAWRRHDDRVEIAVSDGGGQTVPKVNEPGSSAIGGRGLGIVERLSLRWGVRPAVDGVREVTVWAELLLASDGEHADSGHPDTRAASRASNGTANGTHGHRAGEPGLVIASSRDA
jgi:anti-sigma regulatory factor (Ser/Thr protein kinase)